MNRQAWIQELTTEIRELEELIAKAEINKDLEGKWVVYLLKSILKRRMLALKRARSANISIH